MVNSHNRSFFGQNTALMIQSTSRKEDWLFFRCIKRKRGNIWEKPSQGEGKVIKVSLDELVMILKVLRKEKDSWTTYHKYNGSNTQISLNWQEKIIWINIGDYSKMLDEAQIEIMRLLLEHILEEKIEYATISELNSNGSNSYQENPPKTYSSSKKTYSKPAEKQATPTNSYIEEEIIAPTPPSNSGPSNQLKTIKDVIKINGVLKRSTNKALLLEFPNEKEAWIPKSTIHNAFNDQATNSQLFLIDNWVLEKNSIT
ncbi:MAG: hypothetical protein GF311_14410 [Candidatus Lokiarchaeota archaeon]|nr:hypothetical protein [Candidatus Lokiarchaeota archaeon]